MLRPMSSLPNLIAVLAMLLPPGSGETVVPIVMATSAAPWAVRGEKGHDLIYSPVQPPSQSESFFECIDESALDEEDSTRVEDHGLVPLTLLDYQSPLAFHLSITFLP